MHLRILRSLGIAVLVVICTSGPARAQLVISELMATDFRPIRDDDGDASDWIELYNNGPAAIDLAGYSLTDDPLILGKWIFPALTIEPGRFVVVYASGKNRASPDAALHANFELNRLGEYLALAAPDGETIVHQYAPFPAQADDFSYGLSQNASFETLIGPNAAARAIVPAAEIGTAWTQVGFADAAWTAGSTGVGYERSSGYEGLIRLNLRTPMDGINASAYIRIPFNAASADSVSGLVLKMKYDDGFIAYLNGVEIASRNAPAAPAAWNAEATALHDDAVAVVYEDIDVSLHVGALRQGANVLAIHGLNDSTGSSDFLILPELHAVRVGALDADTKQFFASPSPGGPNPPGFPGVADSPRFGRESGVFSGSFPLSMSIAAGGQSIRYTTDGSEPSAASPLYSAPINIADTTLVRARGFAPGLAPSTVVSRTFVELAADVVNASSNLPMMVIETFGQGLNDANWTAALAAVVDVDPASGRARFSNAFDFSGRCGVKYRGSSSLGFPKKNLALEAWDERQEDVDVSILGMPSESDWILHGPYSDKTLMRNYLAYLWSNWIGRYAVRCEFIELYLNTGGGNVAAADYVGVYVLMEKIKRDPDRVDIQRLLGSHTQEPEVSGGYILKNDRPDPGDAGFSTARGLVLRYVEPKEEEITPAQAAWIKGYLDQFEAALYGGSFRDPDIGYRRYIDAGSFIDHHILVELTKNIDGYRLSTFMFKDREGKLNMGPIWDYNLSLCNANYLQGSVPQGWYYTQIGGNQDYPWYPRLFQDPDFVQQYTDRWSELRRNLFTSGNLLSSIDGAVAALGESVTRNFNTWRTLGTYVWPNPDPIPTTYQGEISHMKGWLSARLIWFDSNYEIEPRFSQLGGKIAPGFQLTMSSPAGRTIYYTLDGSDPRNPGGTISPRAVRYSGALTLDENTRVVARVYVSTSRWSGVTAATFFTETPPLVVRELMYHPPAPPPDSPWTDEDFEFLELQNVGPASLDLRGFHFADGIQYAFGDGAIELLAPGDVVVIASNLDAFLSRYPEAADKLAGEYSGLLENAGETLALRGPVEEPVLEFSYSEIWYPETDGNGSSLEIVDPLAPLETWNRADGWRASIVSGGTPGVAEDSGFGGWQKPGDANGDGQFDLSDSINLLRRLFAGAALPLPCDGAGLDEGGNVVVFDLNGDARVNVADVLYGLNFLFKEGPPSSHGLQCVRVEGCDSRCAP